MKEINPTGHHVLVEVDEVEEKTEGGIYKPEVTREREQNQTIVGTVLKVAQNAWVDELGQYSPWAEVGDRVLFAKYGGLPIAEEISDHDKMVRLLLDTDILAVLGK